ncbi:lipoprotein [Leptospira levettii]|uniref:lipoprotein n=1 Tax=Leptospira levettii TaxID=2023178 RepID=UPI000C295B44|nr:lipoprotein [Leptospira levettii]MCW7472759.1 lipoprotein [Leptospira levettii]PJZ37490.1 lipoprotein [Leptospira levettii]PJZ88415.1 lipoprotein [Leptospira levettii]PKA00418.1 lipoprotein [Leptospira levettii]
MNKHLTIALLSISISFLFFQCKSKEIKETNEPKETIETKPEESPLVIEFTKAKEGFVTESLFQVAVSSVLPTEKEREEEAKSIAEQKSLNLLKTYTITNLSDKGKKELREISKEGKIVNKNVSVGGRYFFLYQIQKPNLKRLVTKDLE